MNELTEMEFGWDKLKVLRRMVQIPGRYLLLIESAMQGKRVLPMVLGVRGCKLTSDSLNYEIPSEIAGVEMALPLDDKYEIAYFGEMRLYTYKLYLLESNGVLSEEAAIQLERLLLPPLEKSIRAYHEFTTAISNCPMEEGYLSNLGLPVRYANGINLNDAVNPKELLKHFIATGGDLLSRIREDPLFIGMSIAILRAILFIVESICLTDELITQVIKLIDETSGLEEGTPLFKPIATCKETLAEERAFILELKPLLAEKQFGWIKGVYGTLGLEEDITYELMTDILSLD